MPNRGSTSGSRGVPGPRVHGGAGGAALGPAPTQDVAIVGAGVIGLALARDLHQRGFEVSLWEAGRAGHEASWAAAGMLLAYGTVDPVLRPLAIASARLYPTWIAELERETCLSAGYRPSGSIWLETADHPAPQPIPEGWQPVSLDELRELEPALDPAGLVRAWRIAGDHSVDNRALCAALLAAVRARGIALHEHCRVEAIEPGGIRCGGERHRAAVVVNAAGAWAGTIPAPWAAPVRARKGQLLRLDGPPPLRHVMEGPDVYLVPRRDSLVVGATLEDCGFAPGWDAAAVDRLHQRACRWVPALRDLPVTEMWYGYRPCATDEYPMLGPTPVPGYWMATAHYRDGILLAPITAKILGSALAKGHLTTALDLAPFRPGRFD